jgi:hypothetical protein
VIACPNRFVRTRTHFTFRIDLWIADGESTVEPLAGVEDFQLAAGDPPGQSADTNRAGDRGHLGAA